jgi:hypothetical protein
MKRDLFMAAAAAAGVIAISQPLLGRSEALARRVRVEANLEATGWRESICESGVVWLDTETGIYYHKGDRRYGRTQRGAYACEKEAANAGNRASLAGR